MEETATSSDGASQQYPEVTDEHQEAERLADELISLAKKHGRSLIYGIHYSWLKVKHKLQPGDDPMTYERVVYLDDNRTYVVCALGLGRVHRRLFGLLGSYAEPVVGHVAIVALGTEKLRPMVNCIKKYVT